MSTKDTEKSSSMVKNIGGFFSKFKKKSTKSITKEEPLAHLVKEDKKTKKNSFFSRKADKTELGQAKLKSSDTQKDIDLNKLDTFDLRLNENESSSHSFRIVKAPALNNSMAKSKIRAASKRKPSHRPKLVGIADFERMDVIEEAPTANTTIEQLTQRTPSNSTHAENQLTGATSYEQLSPFESANTPNGRKAFFDSKESLGNSTENIIELAKKSLKNVRLNEATNKPSNTIYTNSSEAAADFQPFALNKNAKKSKFVSPSQNSLVKSSSESLGNQSTVSIDEESEMKPSNSETSSTTSALRNYCQALMSSSDSGDSSGSEKLSKSPNKYEIVSHARDSNYPSLSHAEKPTPIYDNFTLLEETDKARMPVPDSFVYKLNKKHPDTKSCVKNKMTLGDKDPEEELSFIRSKLKHAEANNSRSVEELNAPDVRAAAVQSKKKLAHSKSLRLLEKENEATENREESKLLDKRNCSFALANKIILETKSRNNKENEEGAEITPPKKVSDLIKNLNSQTSSIVPPWKDLAMKKKNAWIQQNGLENGNTNEKQIDVEQQRSVGLDFYPLKTNKVKSMIMGLEEK